MEVRAAPAWGRAAPQPRKELTMSVEKKIHAASGWLMVGVVVLGYLLSMILFPVSVVMMVGDRTLAGSGRLLCGGRPRDTA